MNEAIALLQQFNRDRVYGSIEVVFQDGRVTLIRKLESVRPSKIQTVNGEERNGKPSVH